MGEAGRRGVAAQACLVALHPGTKGAAGASPLARARRAVWANMNPTPLPAKPTAGDKGDNGLAEALQAVSQATQAEKDKSGGDDSPAAGAGTGPSAAQRTRSAWSGWT